MIALPNEIIHGILGGIYKCIRLKAMVSDFLVKLYVITQNYETYLKIMNQQF